MTLSAYEGTALQLDPYHTAWYVTFRFGALSCRVASEVFG